MIKGATAVPHNALKLAALTRATTVVRRVVSKGVPTAPAAAAVAYCCCSPETLTNRRQNGISRLSHLAAGKKLSLVAKELLLLLLLLVFSYPVWGNHESHTVIGPALLGTERK